MQSEIDLFISLTPANQIKYLKKGEFIQQNVNDQIEFLKAVLKPDLSSKTIACILKLLRELKYQDKFFFRKFLYHVDSSVANAARKAIVDDENKSNPQTTQLLDTIKREKPENRPAVVKSFFEVNKRVGDEVLLALLQVYDAKVREIVISEAIAASRLDEKKLIQIIPRSLWYVRSALVEILGARKCQELLKSIDALIHDKNVEVRLKVIDALTHYDRNEIKGFLQVMVNDPIIWVRRKAQKAMASV